MNNRRNIFDGLLILQYRNGNRKAMDQLVKRYHRQFCFHAYRYTRDMDAAKDIVQDSWSIIIRKQVALKNVNRFGSWAMRIVTRQSLDSLHHKKYRATKNKEYAITSTQLEVTDRTDKLIKLREAISQLTTDHEVILRLFYIQGYSLNEISSILEISTGTVKSRLYHAREKLKTIINNRRS